MIRSATATPAWCASAAGQAAAPRTSAPTPPAAAAPCGSTQRVVGLQAHPAVVDRMINPDPMRTTPPPPEVMQVVAAVLGHRGRRRRLTGWQRDDAIRAMTALGDSFVHIGWVLRLHPTTVEKWLRKKHLPARKLDARLDYYGLQWVAHGGCMPLGGRDRIAALRIFAAQGLTAEQAGKRLCMDGPPETVSKLAANHDIKLLDIDATPGEIKQFVLRQRAARKQELIAA